MGVLLSKELFMHTADFELHLHLAAVTCFLLIVAAIFWCGILIPPPTFSFFFGRGQANRELPCPTGRVGAGKAGFAAGRPRALQFVVLFISMGVSLHAEQLVARAADLRLHPAVVAVGLLGVAVLFNSAIQSVHFLVVRRQAEGGSKAVLRAIASTPAPTRHASGPLLQHFTVLCLAMGAAWNAERLLAHAQHLGIQSGVVACFVLVATARFNWEILSIILRVARRPAEKGQSKTVLRRAIASAEAAPNSHVPAPKPHHHHFVVLCLAMGAVLNAEWLVTAAVALGLPSGIVTCSLLAVTAHFNWQILTLSLRIARRAGGREDKMLPRPAASTARSPHTARLAFGVVAVLVSASWFVEPFVAAAEHCLPKAATAAVVLLFAALFSVSTYVFQSFHFHPCAPYFGAAAAQGENVGASTAGVISVGMAVAACLVRAFVSAFYACSPARA